MAVDEAVLELVRRHMRSIRSPGHFDKVPAPPARLLRSRHPASVLGFTP
jgi:hypothetical protein